MKGFFYFLVLIGLVSCTSAPTPESILTPTMTETLPVSPTSSPTPARLRILALGDSYTIGEGVAEELRWPVQLAARLREQGQAVRDPQIIARTGWTTDELSAAIDRSQPEGKFDLVTLLIGVNNQYRGRSADEYRVQFRALLERSVAFAGGRADRVLVLSIPDWSATPYAMSFDRARVASEIDAYNQINRQETEAAGAVYVDITPISRQAGADPELLAADGLHPSGKMYAAWVDLALPSALSAVQD